MSRGAVVIKINGDAASFNNELKKVEKETKDVSASLGKVAAVSALGFGVLSAAIGASVAEFREGEVVSRKTEAVIKATGGAAGVTAAQVSALALSLQKVTNFGDETIQSAENMILKFTNIKQDVFPAVTALALDMAEKFGSAEAAAEFLGKSLNNPIRGMTMLRKEGVVFSEEQQETIKNLVKTGQVAQAQAILLEKLQGKYAGQAQAAADPFIQLRQVIGDVVQVVGGVFNPALEKMAIGLKAAAFYLLEVNPTLIKVAAYALAGATAILGLTAALTAGALVYLKATAIWTAYAASAGIAALASTGLAAAAGVLKGAFVILTGPIGLTVLALSAAAIALYTYWDQVKAFVAGVSAAAKAFFTDMSTLATGASKIIEGALTFNPDKIAEGFATIKDTFAQNGRDAAEAYSTAYDESMNAAKEARAEADAESAAENLAVKQAAMEEETQYELDAQATKHETKKTAEQKYEEDLRAIKDESAFLDVNREQAVAVERARIDLDEKKRRLADEAKYGKQAADSKAFFRKSEVEGTRELFSTLSTLTQSKNKQLFRIGQAAAIANAIMNVAEGVTKALSYGPILGPALAGAIALAGAVQVATISGQTLQAKEGWSGGGSAFGESFVSTFTPREIVVPERFSDGIKKGEFSLTKAGESLPGQAAAGGDLHVTIGWSGDAAEMLEVKNIERRKLGIANG